MGSASNERIHCPKGQAVKVVGTDFRGYTGKTAHDARSSTANVEVELDNGMRLVVKLYELEVIK